MMGYGPGAMTGYGAGGAPAGLAPAAAVEARLAAFKAELRIGSDQESAWQAFAAKLKEQAEGLRARWTKGYAPAQTAPERLAQRAEIARERAAAAQAFTRTVKELYAALTPEQRAIADRRLAFGPMAGGAFGPHGHGRWR